MKAPNIFRAELKNQIPKIEAMIVLLDTNHPDLLYPLWESLSEWVNHIDDGLESNTIQFKENEPVPQSTPFQRKERIKNIARYLCSLKGIEWEWLENQPTSPNSQGCNYYIQVATHIVDKWGVVYE